MKYRHTKLTYRTVIFIGYCHKTIAEILYFVPIPQFTKILQTVSASELLAYTISGL